MYQVLLLVGWNPELLDVSFNVGPQPILGHPHNLAHNPHTQGASPTPTLLHLSSYFCHVCIQMPQKTVLRKLINPAENLGRENNATWSSRGHFGPTHHHQPPHVMLQPQPRSHTEETTATKTQPGSSEVTLGRHYRYFWPLLAVYCFAPQVVEASCPERRVSAGPSAGLGGGCAARCVGLRVVVAECVRV